MESPCAARVFLASVSVSAVAACFAVPYVLNVSNANGSLPSSAAPSAAASPRSPPRLWNISLGSLVIAPFSSHAHTSRFATSPVFSSFEPTYTIRAAPGASPAFFAARLRVVPYEAMSGWSS
eukprot:29864-Pelagococcus_subviridis.AAC.1